MKILLVHREPELGAAWQTAFAGVDGVQILSGDITQVACDAVVSPANSFGFMDGGLDQALSDRFGHDLQQHVQQAIHQLPERELLIGKALVIPTGDDKTPWLIAAPTMRVPMSYQIGTSVNAYLAMKAILLAAQSHAAIQSVAIPGLCTGVGHMPLDIAARQMRVAYQEVMQGGRERLEDFDAAQRHQLDLNPYSMIWDHD